jgi:hypothetical protein
MLKAAHAHKPNLIAHKVALLGLCVQGPAGGGHDVGPGLAQPVAADADAEVSLRHVADLSRAALGVVEEHGRASGCGALGILNRRRDVDARAAFGVRPVCVRHSHPPHVRAQLAARDAAGGGALDSRRVLGRQLSAPGEALVEVLLVYADGGSDDETLGRWQSDHHA